MSYRASIETNLGETFRVLHTNGQVGGNALFSFLMPMANFCAGNGDASFQKWIDSITPSSNRSICDTMQTSIQSHYSGDWDYREDEFNLFQSRNPDYQITENEFRQILQSIDAKWVSIDVLISDVTELLNLLARSSPSNTWWYDSQWTILDLEALHRTLVLATDRGADRVRLKFS